MPTFKDYPIEECLKTAAPYIEKGNEVYQKFTCGQCGSRQTMSTPNKFYTSGTCEACGYITNITKCNYMMHIKF